MITLVLGGSGCGKSEYAESIIMQLAPNRRYYIATMMPFDDEAHRKIARHREMRKYKGFDTVECQTNLLGLSLDKDSDVLLECISNLVANEMFSDEGSKENTVESIISGIEKLIPQCRNLVIVSNNVFTDGDDYDQSVIEYMEYMARVNNWIAAHADSTVEVVCGIPIEQKKM